MMEVEAGSTPKTIGIAVATFNEAITKPLLDGALAELAKAGVEGVVVIHVPGALELPVAALALIERAHCEAVVAIGAVIRGETDHYDIVARESARGIGDVAIRTGRPVTNAVLAVHDYDQAIDRSLPGPGNKGAEAARAAVETARKLASL